MLAATIALLGWIGHAVLPMRILNVLYAIPLPKLFLKAWRLSTGLFILAYAPIPYFAISLEEGQLGLPLRLYVGACATVFLVGCLLRNFRPVPGVVVSESSTIHHLGVLLGPAKLGDGRNRWMARMPFNGAFAVEFTEMKLKLKWLPKELDGLSILLVSDLHFHGTPSRAWYDALFDRLVELPTPDLVVLAGDFVDTDTHADWIAPLLGRLKWNDAGLAVLGNHDVHHGPDATRAELGALGYRVLGNRWEVVPIRGVPVVVVGDERPWFSSKLDLTGAPVAGFRLYVSHTPDNFPTASAGMFDLVLAGHVHGGGICFPFIGSVFVPSLYGRRYDRGVFHRDRTVMVVGRGIGGKEPVRYGSRPQVLRLVLTPT